MYTTRLSPMYKSTLSFIREPARIEFELKQQGLNFPNIYKELAISYNEQDEVAWMYGAKTEVVGGFEQILEDWDILIGE